MPQQTHQLLVTYVEGETLATWSLDGVPQDEGDQFKVYPGDIGTACGIAANAHAQALDAAGAPIPGLYVAGHDMQSVMGGAYPAPGITLGPALTFGWVAGQHLAHAQH